MGRLVQAELTNMCMIYEGDRILVEEKIWDSGKGIIFPGGHVEKGESFTASVIREMQEETGLTIRHPKLCGIKNWIQEDGSRYMVLLYKTNEFEGELCSSGEGKVFWTTVSELDSMELLWDMKELVEIFTGSRYEELYYEEDSEDPVLL